ncbi:MAG: phospho-N-acetylmuramoyl-pentapeptide-transferase [Clostridia bacterium]|nr:phospho-N-acetylmuramoyl-pentapeptide-transferase [Clostridia bacterium]
MEYIWVAAAALAAFVISLLVGKWLIPVLRRAKMGQMIKDIGPIWQMCKQGTPVMGGLMFIAAVLAVGLVGVFALNCDFAAVLCVLFLAVCSSLIGFLDDYEKLMKKRNLGLTALQKIVLQVIVTVVFIALLEVLEISSNAVYLPFFDRVFEIPKVLYYAIATLVVLGTVNSANLTDGVDGLATGVTLPIAAFFAVTAFLSGRYGISVLSAAFFGALCGFLVYNFHPAKVFMGDTGSLFIGGMVCGLAFALDIPLIILVVGIIYFIEALSDILQVGYFKLTHGKRIFKMAPIHHHFELCGWSEKKIFFVFSGVTLLMAGLALWGVHNLWL